MSERLNLRVLIKADGRYGFDRKRVREAVRSLLLEREIKGDVVLSILVVGERKIKELNKKYLGKDEVTDVLSFSQMNPPSYKTTARQRELMLGDVVVCYSVAKKQAVKMNKLLDEEIEFLVLHGVLHLLGVHHD
ncbi:rRNA maturation RNase YbeY [Patescibacteria group bacterium]|nr:rRNA maturation RNase YbeY [Patescibacteria group bacterium]MBU1256159.1 rRNA maturation RNase YbeY [Patescibacteria group bacterium]MBU1457579.1 rRNA maturation RNase YbeY [Patescibacteria group bacterium]